MKIIGIDSSGLVAGVAVWDDGIILAEYTTNYKKTHSQTLLPMLDEIKRMTELSLESIDAIAVASGPGSYTGLRIGSATAKGMGLALGKPVVEVPTLEGLAYNLWGTSDLVCPIMDARRGQVYTGIYEFAPELKEIFPGAATLMTDIIEELNKGERPVIFLGDGIKVHAELIEERLKCPYRIAPAHRAYQSGASIASLGAEYFRAGKFVSAADHSPKYFRKSQAENEGPKHFEV